MTRCRLCGSADGHSLGCPALPTDEQIAQPEGTVPSIEDVRKVLTPAMRKALGTSAGERADLRGLYHGATLNALIRHGLARSERGWGIDDHVIVLSGFGLELRANLRARVDSKLAGRGYVQVESARPSTGRLDAHSVPYFRVPEAGGGIVTRGHAMRKAGVKW